MTSSSIISPPRVRPADLASWKMLITWLAGMGIVATYGLAVWAGVSGVDFGVHWDEFVVTLSVERSVQNGVLLPYYYYHPAVNYYIALLCLIPKVILSPSVDLMDYVRSDGYLHLLRVVHVALSQLTVVFVAGIAWLKTRRLVDGFLASLLVAASFEFSYHARWVASDALMTMFCSAGVFCMLAACSVAARATARTWLFYSSAAAIACATGTKYTCGIWLFCLCAVTWLQGRGGGRRSRLFFQVKLVSFFAACFLITNPSVLLEPLRVWRYLVLNMEIYAQGECGQYLTYPMSNHLKLLGIYIFSILPSPFIPVACAVSLFTLYGVYAVLREDACWAWTMVVFTAVAFALYLASQKLMIVRNYLPLLPVMSALAACGLRGLPFGQVWRRWITGGVVLFSCAGLAYNVWAGQMIGRADEANMQHQVHEYLAKQPSGTVVLSPRVQELAAAHPVAAVSNPVHYLFFSDEVFHEVRLEKWPVNRPWLYRIIAGPRPVNPDYYMNWVGHPFVLAVDYNQAVQLYGLMPDKGSQEPVNPGGPGNEN